MLCSSYAGLMLTILRRHLSFSKHSSKGRKYRSCAFPISGEGAPVAKIQKVPWACGIGGAWDCGDAEDRRPASSLRSGCMTCRSGQHSFGKLVINRGRGAPIELPPPTQYCFRNEPWSANFPVLFPKPLLELPGDSKSGTRQVRIVF